MPITWLFGGIGIAMLLVGLVLRRAWRSDLLPAVDATGYSTAQVREAQRASVEGDAPADRELLPLARAYAARAVHNVPLTLHWLPVLYVGAVLFTLGASRLDRCAVRAAARRHRCDDRTVHPHHGLPVAAQWAAAVAGVSVLTRG